MQFEVVRIRVLDDLGVVLRQKDKSGREIDLPTGAGAALPPELEACLEALFPERDPLTIYRAICDAVEELSRAQRQSLN